jgi:hypothetical protein
MLEENGPDRPANDERSPILRSFHAILVDVLGCPSEIAEVVQARLRSAGLIVVTRAPNEAMIEAAYW